MLPLEYGGETSAWQIEVTLRGLVYAAAAVIYGTDTSGEPAWSDRSTRNIMAMWGRRSPMWLPSGMPMMMRV